LKVHLRGGTSLELYESAEFALRATLQWLLQPRNLSSSPATHIILKLGADRQRLHVSQVAVDS